MGMNAYWWELLENEDWFALLVRLLGNDVALWVADIAQEEVHRPEAFALRWRRWQEGRYTPNECSNLFGDTVEQP
jgi:hypothetical protein